MYLCNSFRLTRFGHSLKLSCKHEEEDYGQLDKSWRSAGKIRLLTDASLSWLMVDKEMAVLLHLLKGTKV